MEIKTVKLLDILKRADVLYSSNYSSNYHTPVDMLGLLLESYGIENPPESGIIFLQKIEDKGYIVVDGLKRLIAFSLLLYSICESYKHTNTKNDYAISLIKKRYLLGSKGFKLQLRNRDKEVYEKLLSYERMTLEEKGHPIFEALHDNWVKITAGKFSPVALYNEIKRVKVMVCFCDENTDKRDLYQCLNYNNDIDELQLIKDFLEENSKESIDIWYSLIDMFNQNEVPDELILFLQNYLTIQRQGIKPALNELYTCFKRYFIKMRQNQSSEEVLNGLKKFGEYYIDIIKANFEEEKLKSLIGKINKMEAVETYTYLLEVIYDYRNNLITYETICRLLETLIIFVQQQKSGMLDRIASSFNFGKLSSDINKNISE